MQEGPDAAADAIQPEKGAPFPARMAVNGTSRNALHAAEALYFLG